MTAITILEGAEDRATVPCIICQTTVPLQTVTAGSLHADGEQAFACSQHIKDRSRWIIGWASFEASQEQLKPLLQIQAEGQR
jgi:hypothetical protein